MSAIERLLKVAKLSPDAKQTLVQVLSRIDQAAPNDMERLANLVESIRPLTGDEMEDGTLGQVLPEARELELTPAVVCVAESHDNLAGILAHELGHVATTFDDLAEQESPFDEWNGECAANRYAHIWGFHDELSRFWEVADKGHHGPAPGETAVAWGQCYIVSEEYIIERIEGSN